MEGTYPIIIDGALAGALRVTQEGRKTRFAAETKRLPGIVRISVYGGGKEGYLGVLVPEGDGMALQKCLSRDAMRGFPERIDSVERAGLLAEHCRALEEVPQDTVLTPQASAAPTAPVEAAERASQSAPLPELPAGREEEELYWYASPDGALVRFDGQQNLIALPLGDPRIPEDGGGLRRSVEGREYLVFRTKNGRLIR